MFAGACFFACMAILTQQLAGGVSWQTIALVRTSVALVIASGLTWFAGVPFVFFRPATLWLRSLSGSCSLVLTFYALTHTQSLSQVLVLTNMFPIWVALLSWPMLGEAPRWDAWLAIACGIAGVVLIKQPAVLHGEWALFAATAASFTTSLAMLGLHRLQHLDARSIVAHFSAVSVLFCLAAMWLLPLEHSHSALAEPRVLVLLLGVGVTATIGQLFLTKAFATGSPAKVSVVGLSQIGITALVDTFNEQYLTWTTVSGMLLIMLPTAWLLLSSDRSPSADVVAKPVPPPPME
jgi:drug/metabolite transporter (DMT)-like permease